MVSPILGCQRGHSTLLYSEYLSTSCARAEWDPAGGLRALALRGASSGHSSPQQPLVPLSEIEMGGSSVAPFCMLRPTRCPHTAS